MTVSTPEPWPALPYEDWKATKQTLHRYTQIVGKVRMALVPPRNHWWHVTLLPATRGLTTGPMPYGDRWVEIAFDLLDHRLSVATSDGREQGFALGERSACADFYRDVFGALDLVGVGVEVDATPFDLGDPLLAGPELHPASAGRLSFRLRRQAEPGPALLAQLRPRPRPVLGPAGSRFRGCGPVTAEAYSHEVIAFGF